MVFFRRAPRTVDARARAFAATLQSDPAEPEVDWLSDAATKGDRDHAAWELRYARRALGVIAAQRDALDDRTGSAVAHAVTAAFTTDPSVDPTMVDLALGQFNARLSAYRDVVQTRSGPPVPTRLGQMLLAFAGGPIGKDQAAVARAGDILAAYMSEASTALQEAFGSPSLPEDVPPSAIGRR